MAKLSDGKRGGMDVTQQRHRQARNETAPHMGMDLFSTHKEHSRRLNDTGVGTRTGYSDWVLRLSSVPTESCRNSIELLTIQGTGPEEGQGRV